MNSRLLALIFAILSLLPVVSFGQTGIAIRSCGEFFRTTGAIETAANDRRMSLARRLAEGEHSSGVALFSGSRQTALPPAIFVQRIYERLSASDWESLLAWPAVELAVGDVIAAFDGSTFFSGEIASLNESTVVLRTSRGNERAIDRSALTLVQRLVRVPLDLREGEVLRALAFLRFLRNGEPAERHSPLPLSGQWRIIHRAQGPMIGLGPIRFEGLPGSAVVFATKAGELFGGVVSRVEWINETTRYRLTLQAPPGWPRQIEVEAGDLEYFYRLDLPIRYGARL